MIKLIILDISFKIFILTNENIILTIDEGIEININIYATIAFQAGLYVSLEIEYIPTGPPLYISDPTKSPKPNMIKTNAINNRKQKILFFTLTPTFLVLLYFFLK